MAAASTSPRTALVLGAGVIGLASAWRLREAGYAVTIWTRDDPLTTTSSVAGAIWYPFLAEPRRRVLDWSGATFTRLTELAREPHSGVRLQRVVEVFADEPDLWWREAVPAGAIERLAAADVPAPYGAAVALDAPVCDVPVHLPWLLGEVQRRGVAIERRAVASLDEGFEVADVVVNCTGLGAAELCADAELRPVRGQLLWCDGLAVPHAWIDDTTDVPGYAVPRSGGVVLGGTAQHGDGSREPRACDTESILAGARRAFPGLSRDDVTGVRVGLRPFRSSVRLGVEPRGDGHLLVHNYGHGGSGYTLAWGCADEVVSLVTAHAAR